MTTQEAKEIISNSTLPQYIKEKALFNLDKYPVRGGLDFAVSLDEIINSFWWLESAEGEGFWGNIYDRIYRGEFDAKYINLSDIIKKSEQGYTVLIKDGESALATQGSTIPEVFRNLADAYEALQAAKHAEPEKEQF